MLTKETKLKLYASALNGIKLSKKSIAYYRYDITVL